MYNPLTSSTFLRLGHQGGNCALEEEEEEEEGKNGAREQEGGEGDEAEKEVVVLAEEEEVRKNGGLRSWVRRRVLRTADGTAATASAAATAAAADAAPAATEYVWPLPEVAAAEDGWEKGSREAISRFAGKKPPNLLAVLTIPSASSIPGTWYHSVFLFISLASVFLSISSPSFPQTCFLFSSFAVSHYFHLLKFSGLLGSFMFRFA